MVTRRVAAETNENADDDLLQPLPFSGGDQEFSSCLSEPDEFRDMINSLIPDDESNDFAKTEQSANVDSNYKDRSSQYYSVTRDESDIAKYDEKKGEGDLFVNRKVTSNLEEAKNSNTCHQDDILGAEVLPSLIGSAGADRSCNSAKDRIQCIYSLALVFYELFGGGERPLSDDNGGSSNGCNNFHAFEPSINLTDGLNIYDGDLSRKRVSLPTKRSFCNNKSKNMNSGISVNQLQLRGLPCSLCDLIANMIDSINYELSSDEAYTRMSDVRADLQLMLDRPEVYLHDKDLTTLSVTGLQLSNDFYERKEEYSTLCESYQRSISGQIELAIISGPSGIGKSELALKLGSLVTFEGGYFLSGKFDQQGQMKPFSALATAFDEYCTLLLSKDAAGVNRCALAVASRLKASLGSDVRHLVKVIPNLGTILGEFNWVSYQDDDQASDNCVDAQKRLQYLLCKFVEIISTVSDAAIVLYLDDVQWEEGMEKEHRFGGMVSGLHYFGVKSTILQLTCMDKETANSVISEILGLSPRLTRSLSEIVHQKSKGNPLFFSRLMVSLYKDGLLQLSLSRRRWEWNEEKIQSRRLPEDVASFLTSRMGTLPDSVIAALCTLSCFGARAVFAVIEAVERVCGDQLIAPLEVAVAEGFVEKIKGHYCFCHDRLEEAAYSMMKPEERGHHHFKYGVALVPLSIDLHDDNMLFIAASQINRGGSSCVIDIEQAILVANLNLSAGDKAMKMSDFTSAFSFLSSGISFLPGNHWEENYSLSLSLFESAAQCAAVLGQSDSLNLLSTQILAHAKTFDDKLETLYLSIGSLFTANKHQQAIEQSMPILTQLGEELPWEKCQDSVTILAYVEQTKMMLRNFTDNDLIGHKFTSNKSMLMVMKLYARLELCCQAAKPGLQPLVSMKLVQLSVARGMSPHSPIGFAYYGVLLARLGDVREAYRYVKIARALIDRMGSKEVAGEVTAVGTQIQCFVEPVQSVFEIHLQGQKTAMAVGDTNAALFNALFYLPTSFVAGTKLGRCLKKGADIFSLMEQNKFYAYMICHLPYLRLVATLIGADDHIQKYNIEGDKEMREANPTANLVAWFSNMYISFIFRQDCEQVKLSAEKYFSIDVKSWSIYFTRAALHTFMGGLVSFYLYRKFGLEQWAHRGREAKVETKKMVEKCSEWNFESKMHLLEAEEHFSDGQFARAEASYNKAISAARIHRFINDEALSCELAGHFFLEIGKKDIALQYFTQAHEKYHEWGAHAKSNALFNYVLNSAGGDGTTPLEPNLFHSAQFNGQESNGSKNERKRIMKS